MKALVTGGTGFIGAHLLRVLLAEGCDVTVIVRPTSDRSRIVALLPSIRIVEADLADARAYEGALRELSADVCFHLAWFAEPGEYLTSPRNLDSLATSLVLARVLGAVRCPRLVAIGTCFEYDTAPGLLSEDSTLCPATLYAQTKDALRRVLTMFAPQYGISFAWARLFYQYGEFEHRGRLVPTVVRALLRGELAQTTLGEQRRDYLHAEDVARALWTVGESGTEGVVNIGSGAALRVRDLVEAVARAVGRPELVQFGAIPRPSGDPDVVCAANDRLARLGWRPLINLSDGIERTVDWWRQQLA